MLITGQSLVRNQHDTERLCMMIIVQSLV